VVALFAGKRLRHVIFTALGLTVVLVVLAACGGGASSRPGGEAGSAAGSAGSGAPAGGEAQAGGQGPAGGSDQADGEGRVGIDEARIGDDGETIEFEGTTGGGQSFAGTAGMVVPEDFPLPVYPEWTVMAGARADVEGGVTWNAAFQFEGEPADLTERYAGDLAGLGLAVEIMEIGSSLYGITFEGTLEGRSLEGEVSIGSPAGMQVINIQVRAP